jgi:hypothetical protein
MLRICAFQLSGFNHEQYKLWRCSATLCFVLRRFKFHHRICL